MYVQFPIVYPFMNSFVIIVITFHDYQLPSVLNNLSFDL
jgi:hypothetical protein